MLFEEDDIRRQRGAMARGEYVDPDPLPEDLEIPDGLLLVSLRQLFAEAYCALLRSCDFGEPDEEAELTMRTANLLILDDEDDVPQFCPIRTLDLFAVMNLVLVLLLRGVWGLGFGHGKTRQQQMEVKKVAARAVLDRCQEAATDRRSSPIFAQECWSAGTRTRKALALAASTRRQLALGTGQRPCPLAPRW